MAVQSPSYDLGCENIRIAWFSELTGDLRTEMKGLRWLLLKAEDLPNATAALMFAELDGILIAIDHRGSEFNSGLYNRAIHLLLLDGQKEILGITKIVSEGELLDYLW